MLEKITRMHLNFYKSSKEIISKLNKSKWLSKKTKKISFKKNYYELNNEKKLLKETKKHRLTRAPTLKHNVTKFLVI